MTHFQINVDELKKITNPTVDLSGINFGMLEMLELWAEKEWEKKRAGKPSEWDQHTWMTKRGEEVTGTACGTSCCLAGKAIQITPGVEWAEYEWSSSLGDTYQQVDVMTMDLETSADYVLLPAALVPESERDEYRKVEQNGGTYFSRDAEAAGRAILGLNSREATALFAGNNDLDDVKTIIAAIKKGDYRRDNGSRRNVPTVDVEVTSTVTCDKNVNSYVRELVGPDVRLYSLHGRCVNLAGHDGEHTFRED